MRSRKIYPARILSVIALVLMFTSSFNAKAKSMQEKGLVTSQSKHVEGRAERRAKLRGVLNSVKRPQGVARHAPKDKHRRYESHAYKTQGGFVRFLSAPRYGHFEVAHAQTRGRHAQDMAETFLEGNRSILAQEHADFGFKHLRTLDHGDSSFVRFQQTFGGLEIIGAQAIVQVDKNVGGVTTLNNNLMRSLGTLADSPNALVPTLTAKQAQDVAEQWMQEQYPRLKFKASTAELKIYDPTVYRVKI